MRWRDKRCGVCREWFEPTSGRQLVCAKCRQYYFLNGITGDARSFEDARKLYLADMKRQRKKVSDWPAARGCEGCRFWRGLVGGGRHSTCCCHYYLDTHIRRPCPPGKRCAVRINKRKGERNENSGIDIDGDVLGLY